MICIKFVLSINMSKSNTWGVKTWTTFQFQRGIRTVAPSIMINSRKRGSNIRWQHREGYTIELSPPPLYHLWLSNFKKRCFHVKLIWISGYILESIKSVTLFYLKQKPHIDTMHCNFSTLSTYSSYSYIVIAYGNVLKVCWCILMKFDCLKEVECRR